MIVGEIDALLARAGLQPGSLLHYGEAQNLGFEDRSLLATSWLAGIERLSVPGSPYLRRAQDALKRGAGAPATITELAAILVALRTDYEAGYLQGIEELVHADVFADFLEMADELLRKHYKDAAAVIVGSVLEEHLRKLAAKSGVPTMVAGRPKKADTINAELTKAAAYNPLQQKQITAWLGLRNDAAHGHYDAYDSSQVSLMLSGVRDFLLRYPA